MWRRLYLALAVLRLYLALSPSYIHPDEHFQGPEVVAGITSETSTPVSTRLTPLQAQYMAGLHTRRGNLHRPNPSEASSLFGWSTESLSRF